MRLREERIGALNLFADQPAGLILDDETLVQAMADVATIGLLHERFIRRREQAVEQLQTAFNTRVVIEQAKGVVAEAAGVDMDEAFARLRGYARHYNLRLAEVAESVIGRTLTVQALSVRTPRRSRVGRRR